MYLPNILNKPIFQLKNSKLSNRPIQILIMNKAVQN